VLLVGHECPPRFHARRVLACACDMSRGTRVHKCTRPRHSPLRLYLAWLLGKGWLVCPPRSVARWELVGSSASPGCSTGVGRSARLAQLLGGSWSDHPSRRVARRELVGSSVAPCSCWSVTGLFGVPFYGDPLLPIYL
jgi:hypothetical protein